MTIEIKEFMENWFSLNNTKIQYAQPTLGPPVRARVTSAAAAGSFTCSLVASSLTLNMRIASPGTVGTVLLPQKTRFSLHGKTLDVQTDASSW